MTVISPVDVRLRVVKAALAPGITLARIIALPLDDLQQIVAVAYFEEARARGLSLRAIARRFGKSLRTIATLSKRSGESSLLLESSRSIATRRTLVEHLGRASAPEPLDALCRAVPDVRKSLVRDEIDQLVEEGVLQERDGGYAIATDHLVLLGDELDKRLESLRLVLSGTTQTIYRRFFGATGEAVALARVLVFSAVQSDLAALAEGSYAELRDRVRALDRAAEGNADARQSTCVLCVVERPDDAPWRTPR